MALQASDRLIDSLESIRGVPVDVFQGLPLLDIMGKSKEISQDLHKSGSSLVAISKLLKVPRSSVQTIVRKY